MILSDLSIRRPVVAAVMAVLLVIVGVVGYLRLPIREYPDTDPPVVSVNTTYTGASAQVVESRITQPIEDRLAGIDGIETIALNVREDNEAAIAAYARLGFEVATSYWEASLLDPAAAASPSS